MDLRRKGLAALAPLMLLAATPAAAATIEVMKSASCGCCGQWVEHLRREGLNVKVVEVKDPGAVSRALGVPPELRSCHSARIGGYVIEGHVPAADIKRLIAQKPKALGLAVPGMPLGSPGMEVPGRKQAYATMIFTKAGEPKVFARH